MLPLLASPWALAALATLPALTALYWMRHSYRRVPVSSLMLWMDQAESRATGLRFQRLQTPLLFLLELAALALLAFAASGPQWEMNRGAPPLIVVLDDSISMQAGGDNSPRKRALVALESDLGWRSMSTIQFVVAGQQSQILGTPTNHFNEARDILTDWNCLAPRAKIAEAVTFARELGGSSARILVVSDRPPPESALADQVVWWSFGEPLANVGIIRAGRTPRDGHDQCYFEIANHSPGQRTTTLRIQADGVEVSRQPLTLAPGEIRRVSFRTKDETAPVEARILEEDGFELDNAAYLVHQAQPPVRAEVNVDDAEARRLIEDALKATGRVLPPGEQPHLLITDHADIPKSLNTDTWIAQLLREEDADAFLGPFVVDRTHPLMEGLGFNGIVWGAGKSHKFPGVPLLLAGNVPLVTDIQSPAGQHHLRMRLRMDLSSVTQSPAWPAFFWNLVQWRARAMPGLERANLALGDSARLTLPPGVEPLTLKRPDGTSQPITVRSGQAIIPAEHPGIYEISDGTTFAISVVNPEKSDLSAAQTGRWGEWTNDEAAPGVVHLAWILVIAVAGILTAHMVLAMRSVAAPFLSETENSEATK